MWTKRRESSSAWGWGNLVRLIDGARIGVLNYVALMCMRYNGINRIKLIVSAILLGVLFSISSIFVETK